MGRGQGWVQSCENEIFWFQTSVTLSRHAKKKSISKKHCKNNHLPLPTITIGGCVHLCFLHWTCERRFIFSFNLFYGPHPRGLQRSLVQISAITGTNVADSAFHYMNSIAKTEDHLHINIYVNENKMYLLVIASVLKIIWDTHYGMQLPAALTEAFISICQSWLVKGVHPCCIK